MGRWIQEKIKQSPFRNLKSSKMESRKDKTISICWKSGKLRDGTTKRKIEIFPFRNLKSLRLKKEGFVSPNVQYSKHNVFNLMQMPQSMNIFCKIKCSLDVGIMNYVNRYWILLILFRNS